MSGGKGTGVLQSVERAMRVLDHIASAPGPVQAKQIARDLGLTRTAFIGHASSGWSS